MFSGTYNMKYFYTRNVRKLLRQLLLCLWKYSKHPWKLSKKYTRIKFISIKMFYPWHNLIIPGKLTELPMSSDPEQPQTYCNAILTRPVKPLFLNTLLINRKDKIFFYFSIIVFILGTKHLHFPSFFNFTLLTKHELLLSERQITVKSLLQSLCTYFTTVDIISCVIWTYY